MFWDQGFSGFLILAFGRVPALLFALSVHGVVQSWVARKLGGDAVSTPSRLTLTPRPHLDPIGSVALFLSFFAWGKPVRPDSLRTREVVFVAVTGPLAHLFLAVVFGLAVRVLLPLSSLEALGFPPGLVQWGLTKVLLFFVLVSTCSLLVNLFLSVFSFLPVFPLEGEWIVAGLLPLPLARRWQRLRPYGPVVLLLVILLAGPLLVEAFGQVVDPLLQLFAGMGFEETLAVMALAGHSLWGL